MNNETNHMVLNTARLNGYTANILRVELTEGRIYKEELEGTVLKEYIGGAALGIKYIYGEVPPESDWSASRTVTTI
jgi:hypothetical protein